LQQIALDDETIECLSAIMGGPRPKLSVTHFGKPDNPSILSRLLPHLVSRDRQSKAPRGGAMPWRTTQKSIRTPKPCRRQRLKSLEREKRIVRPEATISHDEQKDLVTITVNSKNGAQLMHLLDHPRLWVHIHRRRCVVGAHVDYVLEQDAGNRRFVLYHPAIF
jgi:hypothetical protein